jgi:hypothetical protein
VIDVVEILEHWYSGRPKLLVAESLGIDRKTVRKYVTPAERAGFVPGGPPVTTEQWVALAQEWFPELLVPELRSTGFAECNGFHDQIKAGLATNTLATVHQRLRDESGLSVSESTLRRYADVALADQMLLAKVTVRKDDPPPGEEGQSTTASSVWSSIRRRAGGGCCGRSCWSCRSAGTCSCGPRSGWIRPSGSPPTSRQQSSSVVCRGVWCPNMFRATYSGFCSRPRYVPPGGTRLTKTGAAGRVWPVLGT